MNIAVQPGTDVVKQQKAFQNMIAVVTTLIVATGARAQSGDIGADPSGTVPAAPTATETPSLPPQPSSAPPESPSLPIAERQPMSTVQAPVDEQRQAPIAAGPRDVTLVPVSGAKNSLRDTSDDKSGVPKTRSRWYGVETLSVDGGAITLALVAAMTESDTLGIASFGVYMLGAPIVHVVHAHPQKAFGSFLLRSVGPILLVAGFGSTSLSCSTDDRESDEPCANLTLLALGVLAFPAAIAVDAALLARENMPQEPQKTRVGVALWIDPKHRGGLNIGGTF